MSDSEGRAGRGTQRERVFAHKERILELLDHGARHVTIKNNLGLQDIPRTTFQYLVRTIRKEAADREPFLNRRSPRSEVMSTPPAPSGNVGSSMSKVDGSSQPARVLSENRQADPPKQPAPRKRRTGFVVPQSRDAKDLDLDPSKWKKSE